MNLKCVKPDVIPDISIDDLLSNIEIPRVPLFRNHKYVPEIKKTEVIGDNYVTEIGWHLEPIVIYGDSDELD